MTELSDSDVMRIARATADELAKRQAFIMTPKDLASFFGYAVDSTPMRKIISTPGFPPPIQLVDEGRPRWIRSDVEAWARSRYAGNGMEILATVR